MDAWAPKGSGSLHKRAQESPRNMKGGELYIFDESLAPPLGPSSIYLSFQRIKNGKL